MKPSSQKNITSDLTRSMLPSFPPQDNRTGARRKKRAAVVVVSFFLFLYSSRGVYMLKDRHREREATAEFPKANLSKANSHLLFYQQRHV